jgi:ribosomal protein S18 acetylase RimI-like enzyme
MQLIVRSASPDEETAIADLWRASDLVSGSKDSIADFRSAKSAPSSDVLVGVDEAGKVRATVMVGYDGHRGWLYYVATDALSRRRGLGHQMVEAAEDWLRRRGVTKAQLLVLETNVRAISFYKGRGFEVVPRVIMSKPL